MKGFVVEKHGGVAQLQYRPSLGQREPREDEVLVRNQVSGINHYDLESVRGMHKRALPFVPGIEAVGIIEAVGSKVRNFQAGQRVWFYDQQCGTFSEFSCVSQKRVILAPEELSSEVLCASMMKAMLAHFLLNRIFIAHAKKEILVFSAGGGVGHFLCQLASVYGCYVTGVVYHKHHRNVAETAGCNLVLAQDDPSFIKEIRLKTKNQGVKIVFDPIGSQKTLQLSLKSLGYFGLYVAFGRVAETGLQVSASDLFKKSLFFSSPSFFDYTQTRFEFDLSCAAIFNLLKNELIQPNICARFPLQRVPEAYSQLSAGKLYGSSLITF